ncbi:MAG: CerR family C-terminal domain-containing protein [Acidobacteriota bacterium]
MAQANNGHQVVDCVGEPKAPKRNAKRTTDAEVADAKARLLVVAERMFAERGFACTSIRDLATEAGVNIAAVNYHFRSKEELYLETLRYAMRRSKDVTPRFVRILQQAQQLGTPAAAQQGIIQFIETFISHLYGQPAGTDCSAALMSHEMLHPTGALDIVVQEFIQPRFEILKALIRMARPDLKSDRAVTFYAFSIVAQCLHLHFCRPIILQLAGKKKGKKKLTSRFRCHLARHIAEFSIRGLTALPGACEETESHLESNADSSAT